MTTFQNNVKKICDESYHLDCQQITIDLVQEIEDELVNTNETISRDLVGSFAYESDILREVFNPVFEKDIDILSRLYKALSEWSNDIEGTNRILGIPLES